ncbi:MAG TPA: alpha-ketoglutarate-dependent dioxygenase AlkB, partial [Gillisia sp.]|nr:alpha-ketoglutarate-dependent dioxygenase AlkB [Gillisia sp.]
MKNEFWNPALPDLDIKYCRNFLSEEEALLYFHRFMDNLEWQQHNIKIFGKTLPQPRLTALYAETGLAYTYSGLTLQPLPYTKELKAIQQKLEQVTPVRFTHCLANLYRDGSDSMGLHADDEKELGKDPVIASVSLGETRKFRLKHKFEKSLKFDLDLEPGSLLLMQGTTQHFWKHELPKT